MAKFSVAAPGPEQFWLNFGATPDVMVVGWVTADMTAASTVQYGTTSGAYTHTATGNATFYKYSAKYTSGLIHHVPLAGLAPATVYYYKVAGAGAEYSFTSSPGVGPIFPYTIGTFADIGESFNADETVQHMISGSAGIDSYLLNGDISYASGCESGGCGTWDAFQRMMSPLAVRSPFSQPPSSRSLPLLAALARAQRSPSPTLSLAALLSHTPQSMKPIQISIGSAYAAPARARGPTRPSPRALTSTAPPHRRTPTLPPPQTTSRLTMPMALWPSPRSTALRACPLAGARTAPCTTRTRRAPRTSLPWPPSTPAALARARRSRSG